MFDSIMNFIVGIIFWVALIVAFLGWILSPILTYLLSCLGVNTKSNHKSTYKTKTKNKAISNNKNISSRFPGVHEDYDEELQKELIKEGKHDSYNFEEEDLEEDDYHYEDDK